MAAAATALALLLIPAALVPGPAAIAAEAPAHFVVTDRVIRPEPLPFTATVNEIGNGARLNQDSGFEPIVYRTMFQATEDSPDRIVAPPPVISVFDSLRSGALDGAEVEVLRIENGAFRSVRLDRIPPGGFQASDWVAATGNRSVAAGTPRFDYAWQAWNRDGVPDYFTVRAIDAQGGLTAPAAAVAATRPDKMPNKRPEVSNRLEQIKLSGGGSGLDAPRNLRVTVLPEGIARLSWDPVAGAAGYVVYRSDTPPEAHRGYYIALAGPGEPIRAGDLVILRHKLLKPDRAQLLTNRVWNARQGQGMFSTGLLRTWPDDPRSGHWELVAHEPGTPVEEPGESFLRLSLGQGQRQELGFYNHGGSDQNWFEVLEPGHRYRVEFWLRGRSAKPLRFQLQGPYGGKGPMQVAPIDFAPTPAWRKMSASFTVPAAVEGGKPGKTALRIFGPAAVDIDNFRVFRDDAPFLALLPEDAARLRASGFGMLRTHALIKTKTASYDLGHLLAPGGVTTIKGGNTLPQLFGVMQQAGMQPWLQIEPHLSRAEWLGLAEYLAAPYDPAPGDAAARPWAALRRAEGQAAPWTEVFDRILLEIGNETWNRLFAPWIFPKMTDAATGAEVRPGAVYGLYQEYVLSILRESPYWPALEPHLVPVLGGWAGRNYGFVAAENSPNSPLLTHAAYIGGWDEGEGPASPDAQGFSSVLTNVLQTGLPRLTLHAEKAEAAARARGRPLALGTYEAGPGYVMNGLNGVRVTPEQLGEQERVMKSGAAGTATLDNFLAGEVAGLTVQNFFTYSSGLYWSSHARWNRGGQSYPSWETLALYQRAARGDLLAVETRAVPTVDLPKAFRREAVQDGPLAAVYATRKGDRLSVIVISRAVPGYPRGAGDGTIPVAVDLPVTGAERLTRYRLSGGYTANNLDSAAVVPEAEVLPVAGALPRLEIPALPPGAAEIYVFDGVR